MTDTAPQDVTSDDEGPSWNLSLPSTLQFAVDQQAAPLSRTLGRTLKLTPGTDMQASIQPGLLRSDLHQELDIVVIGKLEALLHPIEEFPNQLLEMGTTYRICSASLKLDVRKRIPNVMGACSGELQGFTTMVPSSV